MCLGEPLGVGVMGTDRAGARWSREGWGAGGNPWNYCGGDFFSHGGTGKQPSPPISNPPEASPRNCEKSRQVVQDNKGDDSGGVGCILYPSEKRPISQVTHRFCLRGDILMAVEFHCY